MATRSPRRGSSRSASGKSRRGAQDKPERQSPSEPAGVGFEDITVRAARLGITPERVLVEYARIAFADLRHLIEWHADGFRFKPAGEWSDADAAAISEFVPGVDAGHSRVKLYDKKAALDAIARHLGMFPLPARRREEPAPDDDEEAEDPREFLARELARLAAASGEE